MKKSSTAKKIDLILIAVTLYIILFIIYFYFYRDAVFSMFLSLLSVFVLLLLFFAATKKKRENTVIKGKEQLHCDNIFFSMPYLNTEKQNAYFKNLFEKAGFTVKNLSNIITVIKDGVTRNLMPEFYKKADLNTIYLSEHQRQQSSSDGFIILCESAKDEALTALKNVENAKNIVLTKLTLYKMMKKYNHFPDILYTEKHGKKAAKEVFAYAFKRERFKNYFILAVIMFLFSFVSPFKNYYLIFSAVLFVFCLFTLFNGKKKETANDNNNIF